MWWNDLSLSYDQLVNSNIYELIYEKKAKVDWELLDKETFLMHLQSVEQNTHLHLAVHHGDKPMIRELLQLPHVIEIENKFGNRPLHIAAMHRKRSILRMILDANPDLHARNSLGCSALYLAAEHERCENVQLLLQYGANVNVKGGNCNDTALHKAVRGEHGEIVLALLMYGADPRTINDHGQSSLFLAFSYPHTSLLEMVPSDQDIVKVLIAFCVLWDIQEWKAACLTDSLTSSLMPFTSECEEEIERAKLLILENSGISYYTVLKYSITEIALLLSKERMKVILKSKLNLENFPIYSEMFDFKINAGLKTKYLVKESSNCLKNLLQNRVLLPDFVAENIISHLDVRDLKDLTRLF